MQFSKTLKQVVQAAIIAAIYIVLTLLFAPISFGPVQFRVSESLTILPFILSSSVPGLTVGVFLANLFNPDNLGIVDILFGTMATFISALATYYIRRYYNKRQISEYRLYHLIFAFMPAVIFNGLIVGIYLPFLLTDLFTHISLGVILFNIMSVGLSEMMVVYSLGLALYYALKNNKSIREDI